MKIAILSMQQVKNYGSFLQAFSLKNCIEAMGHTCDFINIVPGRQLDGYRIGRFYKLELLCKRLWGRHFVKRLKTIYKFQSRFAKEFLPYLGVKPGVNANRYDIVVIGSDEVFNFAQRVPWGYTPQLYGRVSNADKVISYAASFGHTTMADIEHYGVKEEMAAALKSMRAISVRDDNSFALVKELTGKEPLRHVDPVLMFDYLPYVKPVDKKDYIIVYTYPNRIKDRKEIEAIRAFARKHGKKLVSIGFYFPWCDETVIPEPFEVLGYIRQADYVVTDTFHGSVMSLKFNRPFAAIVRSTNRQKMTSLLSQFRLDNRIVDNMEKLEDKLFLSSDYDFVNAGLQKERIRSLDYLKANL